MSECKACGGNGVYFDRRCMRKECAHLGRKLKTGDYEVIMECPERACSCRAGASARAALKEKIKRQEERLSQVAPFSRDYVVELAPPPPPPEELPALPPAESASQ